MVRCCPSACSAAVMSNSDLRARTDRPAGQKGGTHRHTGRRMVLPSLAECDTQGTHSWRRQGANSVHAIATLERGNQVHHTWVLLWPHHAVRLAAARLPIGQDADVVSVGAGADEGPHLVKHLHLHAGGQNATAGMAECNSWQDQWEAWPHLPTTPSPTPYTCNPGCGMLHL